MFDLDLLRSFVSVVDAGGFTRAGERVHRTQSTVSQQIRRLEENVGRPLLDRSGRSVTPTDDGERLLSYARRILALADEARDLLLRSGGEAAVRLGLPEDFAAARLAEFLAGFSGRHPALRIDVSCQLSVDLRRNFELGDLDLVLAKRNPAVDPLPAEAQLAGCWSEDLRWMAGPTFRLPDPGSPVPLVVFPQGCVYRNQAVHSLEAAGRSWRVAYTSPNLLGICAAVSSGLGVSVLSTPTAADGWRLLGPEHGFPLLVPGELVLLHRRNAGAAVRELAADLAGFCGAQGLAERVAA